MIVYIYTFPNGKKYVGQTSVPLEQRASRGDGYINSPAVYNAIKKYKWKNLKIETFPCSSKDEMNNLEQYYIKLYRTNEKAYGYNLTIGGEGVIKYDREEIRQLWEQGLNISEIAERVGCIGNTISNILQAEGLYDAEEVDKRKRKRLSVVNGSQLQEYYKTEEHKRKRIQNGLKGAKARSKPVVVYKDKECTQLVGIYESGRKCAKALNIDHSLPSYALRHNHYSSGYYFYFLEDTSTNLQKILDKEAKDCSIAQIL